MIEEAKGDHDCYTISGKHSQTFCTNNGMKPNNIVTCETPHKTKIEDISVHFKKRCTELAMEMIWLMLLKIWEIVWDEMLAMFPHGVVFPMSEYGHEKMSI
jgi:hypothetical protein